MCALRFCSTLYLKAGQNSDTCTGCRRRAPRVTYSFCSEEWERALLGVNGETPLFLSLFLSPSLLSQFLGGIAGAAQPWGQRPDKQLILREGNLLEQNSCGLQIMGRILHASPFLSPAAGPRAQTQAQAVPSRVRQVTLQFSSCVGTFHVKEVCSPPGDV